ncbi:MAG TPA: sigma-70 family RNA polymerase sigma factor [Puia sp.]|nr:sigma-70 family RNA polymerase sigma factor [Puia sp.]
MHPTDNKHDFLQLILANKGIILKICQLYCPDRADREDLTQDIIYQLWRSAGRYNKEYRFSTWMYRVALNTAISFYREGRRRNALPLSDIHLALEDSPGPSADAERLAGLQHCIQGLKEFDRALILLYFEEKSYQEMAEIMGLSETNVATRLSRIKEKLKQCMLNNKI